MSVTAESPELWELVAEDARLDRIATGFTFLEGPVWHPGGYLLFSDIPESVIYRWDERGGASEWRRPTNRSNGLTLDGELRLLACEHNRSLVSRTEHDGTITIVASHYQGKELNSPNDVIVGSDDSVYFTDPHPAGRTVEFGLERPAELDFNGVYRVPPGGEPALVAGDFQFPNGLCLSPDESLLYANDTFGMHVRAFELAPDGTVRSDRVVLVEEGAVRFEGGAVVHDDPSVEVGFPDGMKCDEHGNIYCTGPGGIWVATPDGRHIGTIRTPEFAANMAFGGPDWRTLYVTASTSLYRIELKARSAPLPHMR